MVARHFSEMPSPVGNLLFVMRDGALAAVYLEGQKGALEPGPGWIRDDASLAPFRRQFEEYFAGRRQNFDLPLGAVGTPFQQRVWAELVRIPFGKTITYGELATRVGNPAAMRAVGAANGRNPLSIIVPCHRVVGSKGDLTGYAGGLDRKRWLLDFERVALTSSLRSRSR